MDHLPNVFKSFDNLYQINVAKIQSLLPFSLPPVVIENYVANRLLFPYAIPQTRQESQLEYAILGAVVSLNSGFFYNQALAQINIPPEYSLVYQDINQLIEMVAGNVDLHGQAAVIIPNLTGPNTTGSAIAVTSSTDLPVIYDQLKFTLPIGKTLHLQPKPVQTITIGQTDYPVHPGELGVFIFSQP